MKFMMIVKVYSRWCLACRWTASSEVVSASFPKLTVSLEAEILFHNEKVVSIKVQLVNGMKNPSQSMYKKYVQ